MCRRRSSLLLGKCCQLVAPRTSPIISAAQAVIMLYTCQPFYASTSILSSLLLCLHCLRSSPRLTLPSSSDSTVVCLLLYLTLSFLYLSSISRPSRRLSIPARNAGRKNPTTKAVTRKKRRKWEFSATTRTVFRIHAC